jgi:hypothetical protein
MTPKFRLLFAALLAVVLVGTTSAIAAERKPKAEVPPPPGIDEPGVQTQAPAAANEAAPANAAQADVDPLAPLPKPDARLVRDKASRDRAANAERVAASEITTRQQGDDTVEEYRQNGRLWMIKIRKPQGPVQTFYDEDNSGRLVRDAREGPVSPVYFTLYEWK